NRGLVVGSPLPKAQTMPGRTQPSARPDGHEDTPAEFAPAGPTWRRQAAERRPPALAGGTRQTPRPHRGGSSPPRQDLGEGGNEGRILEGEDAALTMKDTLQRPLFKPSFPLSGAARGCGLSALGSSSPMSIAALAGRQRTESPAGPAD